MSEANVFQRAFEQASIAASITRPDGRWIHVNHALAALLGYAESELFERSFQSLTHPDDLAENLDLLRRALDGEIDSYRIQKRLRRGDGSFVWVQLDASVVRDAGGTPVCLVSQYQDLTERRRIDDRLRESEVYFRALTERSSELVSVYDENGVIKYTNPVSFDVFGYRPEELIGRSGFDLIDPIDLARIEELFRDLSKKPGGIAATEFAVRHRDGSRRVLRGVGQNLVADPAVRGFVLNAYDVTKRRRVEDALRESEARYARIATNVPGLMYQYVFRPGGTPGFTFVSEGARRLFGVSPEAALANPDVLIDRIHPDDRLEFRAAAVASSEALSPFLWEGRVVLPSGEERVVQITARAERQSDGSTVSDGLVTDVTDERRAQHALERSREEYRSLFEQNPDAVYSFDLEGRFISANAGCAVLSGYAPGELLGTSFEPLIVAEDLEVTRAHFSAAVDGRASSYEIAIRHRDGHRVQIGVTNVPMVVGGRVVGVYGIAKDLSRQRQLEQQLRQAQKMEAVGRLAGGVAHDFNNLLTVIISYTQMALRGLSSDAAGLAELREVDAAAGRAAALTRQLLAFSRQQVLQPRRIDVNQTVSDSAKMLRRVIGEDIALHTELAPVLWPVDADPGQLDQVLMNLAVNARDAMPGGGTLTLRTTNQAFDTAAAREQPGLQPGEYAAIVVEDTGRGIDPETLAHIFEPFYTTKAVGEGTGLGLATVYGIVKQSGGYVYVDSTLGAGSRFTVLLPRSDGASEDADAAPEESPPRGTETILLVEDEEAVRGAVRRMLETLGYTVLAAADAAVALDMAAAAAARSERIDLVLTDVVMPGLNGRRLGEALATRWPETGVLYMSGYTDDEILRRGLANASFLEKPFSIERLARVVRAGLDRRTRESS